MQLLDLQITDYKNLNGFHWVITEEFASPALLLMGKNASGKTNVLEALINIFDFLIHSKSKKAPFGFSITYKIEVIQIKIECEKNQSIEGVSINDSFVSVSEIKRVNNTWKVPYSFTDLDNILPENIILYYSGFSGRFWNVSNKFKQEYSRIFRKQKAVALPPIIALEPIHYKMILLSLFSYTRESIEEKHPIYDKFFKKYFNIDSIDSFEIHIKKHTGWIKDHTFENFFDTDGIVRNFIEQIHLAQLDENDDYPELIRSKQYPERVNKVKYKFEGNTALLKLKETFGYEEDIFKLLNILHTTKNLAYIDIKVKKESIDTAIAFNALSEGEQQFLAIKGMIYLLQGKNSLFLWDEPDTFLNPAWQWDLIPNLESNGDAIGAIQRDQFILTTHSPVLLSTVKKQAYYIEKGEVSSIRNTYGLTVDESLEKQSINTRIKSLDEKFKIYFEMIEQGKANSEEALEIRTELEEKLGENHEEIQRADVLISFYE
jgi:predicted ATP-dependent endonuclease of OLD family